MSASARQPSPRQLGAGAARAVVGAVLVALPMLMTMEMWWLGRMLEPWRIAVFLAAGVPVVVVLVRELGFRDQGGLGFGDHLADALVAVGIGALTAFGFLVVLGVIDSDLPLHDVIGLVALQTVPCSIGAAVARSQVAQDEQTLRGDSSTYAYELLLMAGGALLFCFNIAPTEEVQLLASDIHTPGAVLLAVLSLLLLHALVYLLGFRGQHRSEAPVWSVLLGYSVVGYALSLLVCLGLLWVFGRTAQPLPVVATQVVVLGLPAAVGGAAGRLAA